MPKVEIEEADFLAHQNIVSAVSSIMANPESRKMMLKARKIADPKVVIPELDAAEPIRNEIGELAKRIDEMRAEAAEREAKAAEREKLEEFRSGWNRQKSKLREAGFNDAGVEAVEKLAHEKGIPDLEVAAAYFEKLHPAPRVEESRSGGWDFFEPSAEDTFVPKLLETAGPGGNTDDRMVMAEARNALKEFREMARR